MLWSKHRDTIGRAWSNCKIIDSLNSQFIPDFAKITTLIELDLIGDRPSTELFVVGVL